LCGGEREGEEISDRRSERQGSVSRSGEKKGIWKVVDQPRGWDGASCIGLGRMKCAFSPDGISLNFIPGPCPRCHKITMKDLTIHERTCTMSGLELQNVASG
jgi:hypothetical protein